jgi:hypothetical protein
MPPCTAEHVPLHSIGQGLGLSARTHSWGWFRSHLGQVHLPPSGGWTGHGQRWAIILEAARLTSVRPASTFGVSSSRVDPRVRGGVFSRYGEAYGGAGSPLGQVYGGRGRFQPGGGGDAACESLPATQRGVASGLPSRLDLVLVPRESPETFLLRAGQVDEKERRLNARLHSAGHAIDVALVSRLGYQLKATKGV